MSLCRRHFLALAAGAAASAIPAAGQAQSANWATAPFAAADNTATSLSAFIGKPIVLNFWATWCIPCRTEMPSLDALAASVGDQAWILPVSVDDGGIPLITQFYQQYQLAHLGMYHDHVGALKSAFGITAYPTTYLINARGVVAGAYARPFDWNSAVARAAVSALR
jgi:thiol-disulfide isomerase/thioredoxin